MTAIRTTLAVLLGTLLASSTPAADKPAEAKPADEKAVADKTAGAVQRVGEAAGRLVGTGVKSDYVGSVVREPILAGEPIVARKIVRAGDSGYLAAYLEPGMRAMAIAVTVESAAGGFILPNDLVDVIMVRKGDNGNFLTENVLNNVRVLAIDQQIKEGEDGTAAVVGATATLELTPEQAKIITVAQQMADRLTLALRSVADAQENDTLSAGYLLNGGSGQPEIQVIKSGSIVKSGQGVSQ